PFMIDHTSEKEVAYSVTKSPVRDAGFSLSVRRAYDYTCAVCRSRLVTATGNTLVDGAHIIPFKSSRNDDPRNGLALCKSHHWMFDHFMLAIRPDYKIHLSKWMNGNDNRVEETMRCDKHSIMLPSDQGLHPAGEALEYQYERFQGVQ
ncbi:MAG: HNH endonuclease, partial [Balneolales bacterium]